MITYKEALEHMIVSKADFGTELVPIEQSVGMVLAEDLTADRMFPPFDRVTMDGIALNFSSFGAGQREFTVESIAPAGTEQQTMTDPKKCIEVMTGAVLPLNTDTVIRYEDLTITDKLVKVNVTSIKHYQNIHFKGMDVSEGEIIVSKGQRISSAEIAVAATIGKTNILVKKMPMAVVVSTGDELVDVHEQPKQHQIRRSNVYAIQSTLKDWGVESDLLHIPDEKSAMKSVINECLSDYDFLIFSGGVSKGKYDFLPEVLANLKVKKLFHRVKQRPGKPFWFGVSENNKQVFALPGNPVSTSACMYMYVRSWLLTSLGLSNTYLNAALSEDYVFKPDLVLFLQVKIESNTDGTLSAQPIKGNGSGDFANLVHADGFMILPQGKEHFLKGEVYPVVGFRNKF